jgi:tetratricopeptide (TPR) repeat protein
MSTANTNPSGPVPISEATRRRLQSWFQHGKQKSDAGQYEYATDMFVNCCLGDPGSLDYLRMSLSNLQKVYKNNKKGASFAGFKGGSFKSGLKKALTDKDWPAVMKNGWELLKINPWDHAVLLQIAQAVGEMTFYDAQLGYLKAALDAAPKDVEVIRACAKALAYLGDFDQSIAMWAKVQELKPYDEEAPTQISSLQKDKLLGIPPKRPAGAGVAVTNKGKLVNAPAETSTETGPAIQLTETQLLQRKITDFPLDVENYFALADHYAKEDKFTEAERILRSALDMSGRSLVVQEKIEDLLMQRERNKVHVAELRAAKDPSEANKELAQRLKLELARQEMEIYRTRVDRYPQETRWHYELGKRLKLLGNHHEAVKEFQAARHDPERRGKVLLELGESLQQMKQYQPALVTYQKAVEALEAGPIEQKKVALYRLGLLAGGLKELEIAEKSLNSLVAIDFNYKDAAERLDKIQKMRHKG